MLWLHSTLYISLMHVSRLLNVWIVRFLLYALCHSDTICLNVKPFGLRISRFIRKSISVLINSVFIRSCLLARGNLLTRTPPNCFIMTKMKFTLLQKETLQILYFSDREGKQSLFRELQNFPLHCLSGHIWIVLCGVSLLLVSEKHWIY